MMTMRNLALATAATLLACAVSVPVAQAFEVSVIVPSLPSAVAVQSFEELLGKPEFALKLEVGMEGRLYATLAGHRNATLHFSDPKVTDQNEQLRIKDYEVHAPRLVVLTTYMSGDSTPDSSIVKDVDLGTFIYRYEDQELAGSQSDRMFLPILIGYYPNSCLGTDDELLTKQLELRGDLRINEAYIGALRVVTLSGKEAAQRLADVYSVHIDVCPLKVNGVDVRTHLARGALTTYALSQ